MISRIVFNAINIESTCLLNIHKHSIDAIIVLDTSSLRYTIIEEKRLELVIVWVLLSCKLETVLDIDRVHVHTTKSYSKFNRTINEWEEKKKFLSKFFLSNPL